MALSAAPAAAHAPRHWVFATLAPEGSPTANSVAAVLELLVGTSGGQIKVKRRWGGILGDEEDTLRECQRGGIQVVAASLGAAVRLVPELRGLEHPYLFPSVPTFQRAMRGLGKDRDLRALFNRRGLELIGLAAIGWRNISSVRKPIRSPADLQGMRVRSQASDLHLEIWRAWGALPKATALTELNSILEIQMVDAFDVPATFVYATSLDARIKYYTLTRHVLQIGVIVVNKAAWDGLPAAWRETVSGKISRILLRAEAEHVKFDEDLAALLPGRGVSIIQPSPAELAAFRASSEKVEQYIRRTGSREELMLFDRIKKLVAEPNPPKGAN